MKELRQKFDEKKYLHIIVAMEMISTEVPIVDFETADKEIAQDVNEDHLQGKVRTIKTLLVVFGTTFRIYLMSFFWEKLLNDDRNILCNHIPLEWER